MDVFIKAATKIADDYAMPVGLHRTAVICYFFVLREIELGTMLYESVTVSVGKKTVTILLPATKTDPQALSCERSWGCVCPEGLEDASACPFHAALEQKKALRELFGDEVDLEGFPFSPTVGGKAVSKEQMVAAIQRVAKEAGLELRTADGKLNFTGHLFRIGGCRHLARCGVQVPPIMCMARWDSMAVIGYLKDVPLLNITKEYKAGGRVKGLQYVTDRTKALQRFSDRTMKQLEELRRTVTKQEEELEEMQTHLKIVEAAATPRYVVSDKYQKWHVTLAYVDVPAKLMKTYCGWAYGRSVYERRSEVPLGLPKSEKCPRCFKFVEEGHVSD